MRWLVIVAVLVACEKQPHPRLWHAPKVGDHTRGTMAFTFSLQGPDGKPHALIASTEIDTEIVAVEGDHRTKQRLTFVRDTHTMDGNAMPSMTGTFEVTETPKGLDVIRVGGTITDKERAFFTGSYHATPASDLAVRRLLEHTFSIGERYAMTADEIAGFGYGAKSMELVVRDITATAITFDITMVGDLQDGSMTSTGTLKLFDGGRELDQNGELHRGTARVGTVHIVQTSHEL